MVIVLCVSTSLVVVGLNFGDQAYSGNDFSVRLLSGQTLVTDQPVKIRIVPEQFRIRESATGAVFESMPSEPRVLPAGAWKVESSATVNITAVWGLFSMKRLLNTGDQILRISSMLLLLSVWILGFFVVFWEPKARQFAD